MTYFEGDDPFADTKLGRALTRAIVDTIHEPFLVLDADLRIIVASRSFYNKFKVTKEETQGQLLYEIGNGQYDIPALKHFLKNVIPEHPVMKEYKIVHDFMTIGERTMLLSAREVVYENSGRKHLLLTMGDITGQDLLDKEKGKALKTEGSHVGRDETPHGKQSAAHREHSHTKGRKGEVAGSAHASQRRS